MGRKKLKSPDYGVQRFKMNFKTIHLPIAYSGRNRREIFQNSDLVGMNRRDSNLISSKNPRAGHLVKWIACGCRPKIIKFRHCPEETRVPLS